MGKETPKACRNFIPLCTGEGGKIYGEPFKEEFHTRLRFCRRDLIGMSNSGKDDNDFQFFFTLRSTPDVQDKHTIFGKLTRKTRYNILKLEEALVDEFSGKDKSVHDHLTDQKISSQPAAESPGLANKKRKDGRISDWESDAEVKTQEELEVVKKEKEAMKKRIKNTLRDTKKEPKEVQNYKIDDVEDDKGIKENE
ncbi:Peptidyl-prolyl cis-trans isomerase CWC27 like protein [Eufriesea mexicana]|nr:Peptidyl-prolyl cis-trans isomerase CWC27 like protein [Eufriesea mexicana]